MALETVTTIGSVGWLKPYPKPDTYNYTTIQPWPSFEEASSIPKAYVGGTFDLFHAGHVALFARLKRLGYHTVVAVNTDDFAERYKRKPILTLAERVTMLKACRYVDEVLINQCGEDSRPVIEKVAPNVIVHGADWPVDDLVRQLGLTWEWLEERNIPFLVVPYTKGVSSTEIIGRIALTLAEPIAVEPGKKK